MPNRLANPGPRHFDINGVPLTGGKLYFYIPGTTTPKNTYSDNLLNIPNTNPVILSAGGLQPNIFLDGSYRVILTDEDDIQIWDRDNVNDADAQALGLWSPSVTYNENDTVLGLDGNFYISLVNNNLGNEPSSSPAQWQQFKFITVGPGGELQLGTVEITGGTIDNVTITNSSYVGGVIDGADIDNGTINGLDVTQFSTGATSTVTTSPTDTTADRITKVGDYGWGVQGSVPGGLRVALDDAVISGAYHFSSTDPSSPSGGGSVLVTRYTTSVAFQLATSSAGPTRSQVYSRISPDEGATWEQWWTKADLERDQTFTGTNSFIGETTDFTRIAIGTNLETSQTDLSLTANSVIGSEQRMNFVSENPLDGSDIYRWWANSPDSQGGTGGATQIASLRGDGIFSSNAYLPNDNTPADYDDYTDYGAGIRMVSFSSSPVPGGASNAGIVVSLAQNAIRGMQLIASNVNGPGLLQWRPVHTGHPGGMGPSTRVHDDNSFATLGNWWAGNGDNPLSSSDIPDYSAPQPSSGSGTFTANLNTGTVFERTLTGNSTLGVPSNLAPGKNGLIFVIQNGTGGWTLAYAAGWEILGGSPPAIDTTAGAVNMFWYYVRSGNTPVLVYQGVVS